MFTKTICGKEVRVTEEGFFVDPGAWTEEMAEILAKEAGIEELTDRHRHVINFMRRDYYERGEIPTIRRIKNFSGVSVKEIYELFPDGPAKKAAYISGLGKPDGCL
jgi:TusE/DsrC/DsvC family sulfur relay protein